MVTVCFPISDVNAGGNVCINLFQVTVVLAKGKYSEMKLKPKE
jgi:hypothetical protein